MSLNTRIAVATEVDDMTAKAINDGLDRYNEVFNGPDPTKPLWVVCRETGGALCGGLQGFIQWDWFVVGMLWVKEEYRGKGIGSRLLREAEANAIERGCTRSRLATMTFQAPDFYARHGYAEACRLRDVPPSHDYIFMMKSLVVYQQSNG